MNDAYAQVHACACTRVCVCARVYCGDGCMDINNKDNLNEIKSLLLDKY